MPDTLPSHVPPERLAALAELNRDSELQATRAQAARALALAAAKSYREALLLCFIEFDVGKGGSFDPQTGVITRTSPPATAAGAPPTEAPQNGAAAPGPCPEATIPLGGS